MDQLVSVGESVETYVESTRSSLNKTAAGLSVRLLGQLAIARYGEPVKLPSSRKLRALLAYLALAPRPVSRSRLCELLWDVPNDPRGELRWCLSKLRGALDEPALHRIETDGDTVALRLADASVDAVEASVAAAEGIETLGLERLRTLAQLFAGDFLDGLELDRSPHFTSWLTAQRRRFSSCHVAVLEHIIGLLPQGADEAGAYLDKWLELAPFDGRAHVALLENLARRGQIGAGEEHLATAAELFHSEGLDFAPLREAWHEIRARNAGATPCARSGPTSLAPQPPMLAVESEPAALRRASLAVMPFAESAVNFRGGLADGLTHDIITRLAKLRDFFVIARGSVFALAEKDIAPEDAGRRLNVDYVATGSVRSVSGRVIVSVELVEVRTARIVWAETFEHRPDEIFAVIEDIGNSIVSSIAAEIATVERNRAMLKAPNSLNAWEAYHRGLWHMYRFTRQENELAQQFFNDALKLDPTFARAYAGLSFTHWQNAFQRWGDRDRETALAFESAGHGLLVDDRNPAAHWAMGRALWLRGDQDGSLIELAKAVDLSPNFALGHYALSFVHSQSGDPQSAIGSSDHSRHLSPFDPLLFGMMGARAMAHARLGQFNDAAEWALKAAARPNAHVIILAIAAHCLALAGRQDEARNFAAAIRKTLPDYRADDFIATFRFDRDAETMFRKGSKLVGLS
ncbi:transcriptional regulator [Mesorhizobium sp. M1C.F.Ca.ET.193.01.1.1]|uniref:BTAD domain-containing putative transcriptional regulator n=1 Tax=unclassified Mesorhizobium TaxID=325217 RepID=UPI000FD24D09|nr:MULTISPECIES: BTAD domain-containing putative transcriptional regulator [unclassified Mesorhizobium]TGT02070.1 transcriptional regulator [bacterium M00.F.Ca.ET.177.01.1.1]TGQ54323.1 transcriptional regulator [Mesorhizobium sp. M1C.F.Ca.ET.210.01.1.1]TGQ72318.1 transcriptional regulator [Mesorhizobium sp. M1C.F.Ca.ET.212.01.1.1]TGR10115.1 transcriptional regulator [Mesorhizobium sp. M1C.F.Ca.ET.204.01.1.1]TGR30718.1 transcriptional regulator [Mesorhizobium sp. M1C.F.Ca.ET.196.01.1.1]